MSETSNTMTELQGILLENASLKQELAGYKETTASLQALSDSVIHLEEQKKALQDSIFEMEKEGEKKASIVSARAQEMQTVSATELEALESERARLEELRDVTNAEVAALKAEKEESSKLKDQIEAQKQEMMARQIEILENKKARSAELSEIKKQREEQEIEKMHLESMRDESLKAVEENRSMLEEINKAREGSEKLMNDINEARQKAEDRRVAAQNEISSAAYAQDMAKNMMTVFRQALNQYIQFAGQQINIPEITDEHRRFIANDLLSQCAEEPENTEETIVSGEIAQISELRKRYEERFQKKPFMGWGVEELSAKLK